MGKSAREVDERALDAVDAAAVGGGLGNTELLARATRPTGAFEDNPSCAHQICR